MSTDPITQIAETLAESLYHATTNVATHTSIALAANSLANVSQHEEPQENGFFNRATSWLNPFPKLKKALTFLGLEGIAHLAKEPANQTTEKFTPTAKNFLAPIVKKAIEPVFKRLQEQGLIVIQDPEEATKILEEQSLKAAENAKKLQEATTAATQATQAAAQAAQAAEQAIKNAANTAAKMVKEVKNITATANAPWLPEWISQPTAPEWIKSIDLFGFLEDEDIPAPVPPSAAEQAAQQTQSLINQAVNLAQTAAKKAQVTIELTQKAAENLGKEAAQAFTQKVTQAANAAKNASTYVKEATQEEFLQEALNNPTRVASRLLAHVEKRAPQAGKAIADLCEQGVKSYNYTTSVAGSLVENVGEALGVSNPVALGVLATAGILSYWGLKSGYNCMFSSTDVSNTNINHNMANAQPIVNVYNQVPVAAEANPPKPTKQTP